MYSQSRRTLLLILLFITIFFTPALLSGQGFGGGGNSRIDGKYKFIQTPFKRTEELYNLSVDPFENNDLLKGDTADIPDTVAALRNQLEQWAQSARPLESYFEQNQRKETIKRLKSLGYMR